VFQLCGALIAELQHLISPPNSLENCFSDKVSGLILFTVYVREEIS